MNRKPEPMLNPDLERIYRESGAAEPAAGLDRIVLARAEQALDHARRSDREPNRKTNRQSNRHTNRRPGRPAWLAGITTAAVALVALAVVLQQGPPTAPDAAHQPARIDAWESPAVEFAPVAPIAPAAETGAPRESASAQRRAFAAPAPQLGAEQLEPAPATAVVESESSSDEVRLDSIAVTRSRSTAEQQALADHADAEHAELFRQLRELIREGQFDQARALLQQTQALDDELVLPDDLEKALHTPDQPD